MATQNDPIAAATSAKSNGEARKKRVAVVGSGVAGLACAWALNEHSDHDVVLFEANDYVGGHTHTVNFNHGDRTTPVDSGFIVSKRNVLQRAC